MVDRGRATVVRRGLVAAAAALGAAAVVGCNDAPPAGGEDAAARQVTVVGQGEVSGVPDTLVAEVAVETVAPDVSAALDGTNATAQAVIDALGAAGVDRGDIATATVTLAPVTDPTPVTSSGSASGPGGRGDAGSQTITGYRAANALRVTLRDLPRASQVLAAVADAGGDATRIDSVSYRIDDDSQLVRDARTRAFADARDRAEQYAGLSGSALGPVVSISESAGPAPLLDRAPSAALASPVPLESGTQTVSFAVTAVWELR